MSDRETLSPELSRDESLRAAARMFRALECGVRARSPLRISFGGGGTDVSPYCDERGGAVLNATINRYAYATVRPADRIVVSSLDFDQTIAYDLDDEFVYGGQMDLAVGILDHFRRAGHIARGIEVLVHNDAPPGSGLGSSSAVAVAMISAIGEFFRLPLDAYAIAERAFRIERVEVGQKGGRQDQYAAAFGGFNFMEFTGDKAVVQPLRVRADTVGELEYRLVFAYVGGTRFSSHIIERQSDNFRAGRSSSIEAMDALKSLSYQMRDALLTNSLDRLGTLLHEAWQAKKAMAEGISNPRIDEIYETARAAGALGGKITGAGGGGFMFFLCAPARRFAVQRVLRELDCQLVDFSFTKDGVKSWMVPS